MSNSLTLDTCEVTYTFRPTDDDTRFLFKDMEVNAIDLRCFVVSDEGDPYLYTDVTVYGYHLTKTGARNKTRGHGPLYISPYAFPGRDEDFSPSALITEWIGPAMRDIVLPRHPEFAGLSVEGNGPLGTWLAENPAVAQ